MDPFGWMGVGGIYEQKVKNEIAWGQVALSGAPAWQPILGKNLNTSEAKRETPGGGRGCHPVSLSREDVHLQRLPLTDSWSLVSLVMCSGSFPGHLPEGVGVRGTLGGLPWMSHPSHRVQDSPGQLLGHICQVVKDCRIKPVLVLDLKVFPPFYTLITTPFLQQKQ